MIEYLTHTDISIEMPIKAWLLWWSFLGVIISSQFKDMKNTKDAAMQVIIMGPVGLIVCAITVVQITLIKCKAKKRGIRDD